MLRRRSIIDLCHRIEIYLKILKHKARSHLIKRISMAVYVENATFLMSVIPSEKELDDILYLFFLEVYNIYVKAIIIDILSKS